MDRQNLTASARDCNRAADRAASRRSLTPAYFTHVSTLLGVNLHIK
jgi:hypothetical protein